MKWNDAINFPGMFAADVAARAWLGHRLFPVAAPAGGVNVAERSVRSWPGQGQPTPNEIERQRHRHDRLGAGEGSTGGQPGAAQGGDKCAQSPIVLLRGAEPALRLDRPLRMIGLATIQYAEDRRFYPPVGSLRELQGGIETADTPRDLRYFRVVGVSGALTSYTDALRESSTVSSKEMVKATASAIRSVSAAAI